jgi:hypothetical protein
MNEMNPTEITNEQVEQVEEQRAATTTPASDDSVPEELVQQEEEQPSDAREPHILAVPEWLPISEQTTERMAWVEDFSAVAARAGLDQNRSQQLLEAVIDFGTAVPYSIDLAYVTPEEAAQEMERMYGEGPAAALIASAKKYTKTLGPEVRAYLDRTGLGSDVATVSALAFAGDGWFEKTPAEADAAIRALMENPKSDHFSADSKKRLLAVAHVQILSRIKYREVVDPNELLRQDVARRARPDEDATAAQLAQARRESADMLADRAGPLMNAGHRDHAAAVARFHELTARL